MSNLVRIISFVKKLTRTKQSVTADVIPRSQHNISRNNISENALKVLYRLHKKGYQAYLVGGGVRDLLLGVQPKDFDIVTNALPTDIRKIFNNCRLIGRRFRLAHIYFGRNIIEVATFRAQTNSLTDQSGMILRDNAYGSIEQDVMRRDFTINALYYNIADFSIVDYVGGVRDLYNKQICLIGDPMRRYREDPVRMLRALRFAAKLQFTISADSAAPINKLAKLLLNVSADRLYEEVVKIVLSGYAYKMILLMQQYKLFDVLFPMVSNSSDNQRLIKVVLQDTDNRVANGKKVNPSFVIAALLWNKVVDVAFRMREKDKLPEFVAYHQAMHFVLNQQRQTVSVTKRATFEIKEIWQLQLRLKKIKKKPNYLLNLARFRAAYDLLLLRVKAGDQSVQLLAKWWTAYIAAGKGMRNKMVRQGLSSIK